MAKGGFLYQQIQRGLVVDILAMSQRATQLGIVCVVLIMTGRRDNTSV